MKKTINTPKTKKSECLCCNKNNHSEKIVKFMEDTLKDPANKAAFDRLAKK